MKLFDPHILPKWILKYIIKVVKIYSKYENLERVLYNKFMSEDPCYRR